MLACWLCCISCGAKAKQEWFGFTVRITLFAAHMFPLEINKLFFFFQFRYSFSSYAVFMGRGFPETCLNMGARCGPWSFLISLHPRTPLKRFLINILRPSFGPYSSPSFPAKNLLDRGWNWTCDILLKNFHRDPCLAAIFVLTAKVGISAWEKSFPRTGAETFSVWRGRRSERTQS